MMAANRWPLVPNKQTPFMASNEAIEAGAPVEIDEVVGERPSTSRRDGP